MENYFFLDAPREYLVLNPGDITLPLAYDGENFLVPAGDEIVTPDPLRPKKFYSGKNSAGEFIPGSLLLRDIPGQRSSADDITGARMLRGDYWSAGHCLKHCLGIPLSNAAPDAQPVGPLADRGLTVLPVNPAPDLVNRARAEGRAKFDRFMGKWAMNTVHTYQAKAEKMKKHNLVAETPGEDYYKALEWQKKNGQAAEKRAQDLGGSLPVAQDEDDSDLLAFARIQAEKMAEIAAQGKGKVDLDALAEILLKDPDFMAKIKKTHHLRKRRKKAGEVAEA